MRLQVLAQGLIKNIQLQQRRRLVPASCHFEVMVLLLFVVVQKGISVLQAHHGMVVRQLKERDLVLIIGGVDEFGQQVDDRVIHVDLAAVGDELVIQERHQFFSEKTMRVILALSIHSHVLANNSFAMFDQVAIWVGLAQTKVIGAQQKPFFHQEIPRQCPCLLRRHLFLNSVHLCIEIVKALLRILPKIEEQQLHIIVQLWRLVEFVIKVEQ